MIDGERRDVRVDGRRRPDRGASIRRPYVSVTDLRFRPRRPCSRSPTVSSSGAASISTSVWQRLRDVAARSHQSVDRFTRRPGREPSPRRAVRRHRNSGGQMEEVEGQGTVGSAAVIDRRGGDRGDQAERRDRHVERRLVRAARSSRSSSHHPRRVDFDLSSLEFMDSSGIALLLRVAAKTDVGAPARAVAARTSD